MAVDFIPSVCAGTAIFQCLANKDCDMLAFVKDLANPLDDIGANFDLAFGDIVDVTVSINSINVCLVVALTQAIVIAGKTVPTFPPSDAIPDFSATQGDLSDMGDEISNQLGFLDSIFTLEQSGGKVTRVQSA